MFMETRFGEDFSGVRVHTDAHAAQSSRQLDAVAYTIGRKIFFAAGQYRPQTRVGQRLLAHELTHVVQQKRLRARLDARSEVSAPGDATEREAEAVAEWVVRNHRPVSIRAVTAGSTALIQRQATCLSGAVCTAILGSAEEFGSSEASAERSGRARRGSMMSARAGAHGHGGRARQLELFLNAQSPGLLANIHGIFIDQDLSPRTRALTMDCASFVPPITGAVRPCVFVHGSFNQEALAFNTGRAATIRGSPREEWRLSTLTLLTHEIQHVAFETAARPAPAGVTCTRATVEAELSELNARMSEFPILFRAIPSAAGPADPARRRLADWFTEAITNRRESIRGILTALRCKCSCPDVDAYVRDTFNFVSAAWTTAERDAFNHELRETRWGLTWPL
jgi:hypothetical protein